MRQDKICKIHIKLDTGMSRIGFQVTEQSADEIAQIAKMPHIMIEGIFTHFATADEQMIENSKRNTSFSKKYWLPLKPFLPLSMLVIQPPLCGMRIRFSQLCAWEMSCMA